ncbi:HNH endonuclease [uncultured Clostridium sp.]|uniref:HNH endonuclease n=1 Tax=uncultured Clostridium sp. TaxID=59620 RepID=UPI0025DBB7AE|nr:HNH endonuclease [uncultured Clostridium sp.]
MRYKGCPRCKRKMPLEVKGQCEECRRKRYKYLKTLPSVKRDRVQKFYNNPQWARVRLEAIKRANGLCEVCKAKGRFKAGNEVHHIVKVANGNSRTHYDLDNLIFVCTKCHRVIERMNIQQMVSFIQI